MNQKCEAPGLGRRPGTSRGAAVLCTADVVRAQGGGDGRVKGEGRSVKQSPEPLSPGDCLGPQGAITKRLPGRMQRGPGPSRAGSGARVQAAQSLNVQVSGAAWPARVRGCEGAPAFRGKKKMVGDPTLRHV